jgi:hypothetical protein
MSTRVHRSEIHVDQDGKVYVKVLDDLNQSELEALRLDFNSTQDVYAGLSDPPGGSTPGSNCLVILLKCGTTGETT